MDTDALALDITQHASDISQIRDVILSATGTTKSDTELLLALSVAVLLLLEERKPKEPAP